jgi:hypothetical protein
VAVPSLFLGAASEGFAARDNALRPPAITDFAREPRAPVARELPSAKCENCAVIRSIREIERTRPAPTLQGYIASPQYRDTRTYSEPRVGPVVGFTFGPQRGGVFFGAAGSPEMQALKQNSYEVVVRFDDGRYALYEQDDVSDLRVGDKVRVIDNRAVFRKPGIDGLNPSSRG